MSKQPKIRFREIDNDRLRKSVKNYNAKLARERKKLIEEGRRYEAALLPPKASVRELRKAIETRKDFNRELDRMQHFIKTGDRYKVGGNTMRSLQSVSSRVNLKIERLSRRAKTQGEKAALPEKISPESLIKNAPNEEALREIISDYRDFLKRGAEDLVDLPDSKLNIKLTKWQNDLMDREIQKINDARAREKQIWLETEVKYGGKSAGYTQGAARMQSDDFDQFYPMHKYSWSSTYGDMREKLSLIFRERGEGYWEARTELARINYIETMDKIIGVDPIGKILMKQIKKAPLDDFKRTLLGEDDLFNVLYDIDHTREGKRKEGGDSPSMEQLLHTLWKQWNPDKTLDDLYNEVDRYIDREVAKL